ncbi:glutathione S-transferase family protein [uncultured Roseovarius sp.]|uniref:glutathione S-transferase family protein n=1 Tax=uncultured Roseovarius sp. TaxID=293344 RepID=UPI00261014C0|nr:glutathione S-transferase family protein [uncultured Roseovarius sp.]
MKLHHVPFSRSFRVLWLLEELGLECEIVPYSIRDGSLRDPAFLAISPAGRVPALETGKEVLCESGAILQHLCEMYPEAELAPVPGDVARARYLELMGYAETMASLIENLNMQHIFLRDPRQASPVVIKLITSRLGAALAGLETRLGEREYLLDSGFSAADVMLGFNLFAAPYYVKLDPFEALVAYCDRLAARPAYQSARAKDGKQDIYSRDFYPVPEA